MLPVLPVLVACSHGTASAEGRHAVAGLVSAVASRRPDLDVRAAFVDVQQPAPDEVLDQLDGRPARLVPLLLSAGYHVFVDLQHAAGRRPHVTLAPALGPDPRLAALLHERLRAAAVRPGDHVVLAAAGSSEPAALHDCEAVAAMLGERLGRPVTAAYLSAAQPRLDQAVSAGRARAGRVVVATYLLAPGYFADLAAAAGADEVTPPLLLAGVPPPEELVDIVLERHRG